jgi:hypothetical protein
MGKSYVFSFFHEETGSSSIADAFGMPAARDEELATQLLSEMSTACKEKTEGGVSCSEHFMKFIEAMDPADRGPFIITAAAAYYAKKCAERKINDVMKEALRDLLKRIDKDEPRE